MYNQAIDGKKLLLDWYSKNRDFPYYFIFSPSSRESIIDSSPDVAIEDYPFERSFADLEHSLAFLTENSTYGIKLQKKFKVNHQSEKRENYYKHITDTEKPKPQPNNTGVFGFDNENLIGKIEKRSEELYHQRWLADKNEKLTSENAELKIKLADAESKLKDLETNYEGKKFAIAAYNDLKPMFPDILKYFKTSSETVNITGLPKITVIKNKNMQANDNNNSGATRLEEALKTWFTNDPNALKIIEKIASITESDLKKYMMYKEMIL